LWSIDKVYGYRKQDLTLCYHTVEVNFRGEY